MPQNDQKQLLFSIFCTLLFSNSFLMKRKNMFINNSSLSLGNQIKNRNTTRG